VFIVYRMTAEDPLRPLDLLQTESQTEAEEHYQRLKRIRTNEPGAVILKSPDRRAWAFGHYRTDRKWHEGSRERVVERLLEEARSAPNDLSAAPATTVREGRESQ
jgi:hypothetical protein